MRTYAAITTQALSTHATRDFAFTLCGARVEGWWATEDGSTEITCEACLRSETQPCPDPQHAAKMKSWANKCDTCHGTGEVLVHSAKFRVASGPERPVFRHEDLT